MERAKKTALIAVFALFIFGLGAAHIVLPDKELSYAERRRLGKLPELSADDIFSGEYFTELDEYLLDQFPLRDEFRTLKAGAASNIFFLRDNNGLYSIGDGIYKLEYPLKTTQVELAAKKISAVIEAHPEMGDIYLSVIPDKNYFVAAQNGYLSIDYDSMLETLRSGVPSAEYIDLFPQLTLEDYYRTDTHWRQERLLPVAETLCAAMDAPFDPEHFAESTVGSFQGVLASQSALKAAPDELRILESEGTKTALVKSAEHELPLSVYTLEDFSGMEPYDTYLSGAEAVLTIENPNAVSDKKLVIFRDSFGSSLAPLLIDSYSKITLIDLRYVQSAFLDEFAEFDGADVLFIYSTMLLNSGGILK